MKTYKMLFTASTQMNATDRQMKPPKYSLTSCHIKQALQTTFQRQNYYIFRRSG